MQHIKFLLNFVMFSRVIMIVSRNFASHLEFDYTGRCVHVVSPHAPISSNIYLPLCCCNDVIRAVDRGLLFSLPCYVYFPLWYGFHMVVAVMTFINP
jgi:hypothetical protein